MADITTVEALTAKIAEMRKAQQIFSTYSQEQVDKICCAVAMAAIQNRVSLAKMAVQETQMGILEDKIFKNHFAAEFVYHKYRDFKTCGVLETDEELGIQKVAAPLGLVGAILPVTNPTSSAIFKILLCMKTRNAILLSPHPKAKDCTCAAVECCAEAAYRAGAPQGIIECLAEPALELTQTLMQSVDLVLATGGADMVRAAYASGRPAIGAGSGNCPVIIHESACIQDAIRSIVRSKTFDAGLLCSSEQAVIAVGSETAEQVKNAFERWGGHVLDSEECDSLRELFATAKAKLIGKKANFIARLAGVDVPTGTKLLVVEASEISAEEPFALEKLCPVLTLYQAESYFQALDMAEQLLQLGGEGHTVGLYIDPKAEKEIALWRERMKACRLLVNSPTAQGAVGNICTGLPPALTLGCGTWGGSGLAGNLEPRHLLNVKTVAFRQERALSLRMPQAVYHEAGCTGTALLELQEKYHYERVFFLTDHYLYQNENVIPVLKLLERMGVMYTVYCDLTPSLTVEQVEKGITALERFQPDVIVGMGGGTALDAAKLMRYRWEHPEVSWEGLRLNFLDERKRVLEAEKREQKTPLFTIATTAGTGAECTPCAVVTDEKTGVPWQIYHPELLPTAAIIDADHMKCLPKGLTREGGMGTLTRALESYLSLCATDYTDGFALFSCKNVLDYLLCAYDRLEEDEAARRKLADASALAGMAAANTFPGSVSSMACALSAWHHLPYGVSCGILLPEVMAYQLQNEVLQMNQFFNRPYRSLKKRYRKLAAFCGLGEGAAREPFAQLLRAVQQLRDRVEIYPTIQAYGVEEAYFLDTLDRMTEVAWNHPWMNYSPVVPGIAEVRKLYLCCYYGEDWKEQRPE